MINPIKQQLSWIDPCEIAKALIKKWGEPGFIWLDGDGTELGRQLTLAANPIDQICCRGMPSTQNSRNPFEVLKYLTPGHWTGWLGYEAGAWIEPQNPWKNSDLATLWIAKHDPIFKFDLKTKEFWIEGSNAYNIKAEVEWLEELSFEKKELHNDEALKIPIDSWEWFSTNLEYKNNVDIINNFISVGDIFQANLANGCRTILKKKINPLTIYLKLRKFCPAPFSGLIIGDKNAINEAVISASPERFVQTLASGAIESRPIKGTRPRHSNPSIDSDMAAELICSTKDRAENIMIVDLIRNDLGRVCKPGSINVPQLVGLESYNQVHHLTSVIKGHIEDNLNWVDLLKSCWPGGSISGAPKLRACKRLYDLESFSRGAYCGSILNIDWNGNFDSNILIRSMVLKNRELRAYAGCGIVADSNSDEEVKELNWKLIPLLKALQ